jgi:Ca-activated chloride channel family protein
MAHESALLRSIQGEPIALLGVAASGKVNGLLFELTVEQRYRNATDSNIEAVYTFPLPHDAVLLDVEVAIAGRRLKGVVVEKRAAEASYEQAIDGGNTAVMLERAGDGLLTANFGNLMPGEEASIRYRFAQPLRVEHGTVRITVPTVIAPRYGDPATAGMQAHQAPVHDLGVSYPFALTIELAGAIARGTIGSPTHPIRSQHRGSDVVVTLDADATLDRDFVLTAEDVGDQSLAVVESDEDGYVALASFVLDRMDNVAPEPLRLKILLDCSGSMAGDSIDAARRALQRILASLTRRDRFSLSRFGSHVQHITDGLVAVGRIHARRIAQIQADLGGTEMARALEAVYAIDAERQSADVLLVTDGEIWAVDALIAKARGAGQRVFVVGVGNAVAESVLRRLASATGGACEFIAPSENPENAIVRMVERLRAPRIDRVEAAWPASPSWSGTPPRGMFLGETVHVFAGFATPPEGEATLRLLSAAGNEVGRASIALDAPLPAGSLARVAAAARLQTLDEAEARLALALRYGLLTDTTNVLVVHERAEAERANPLPTLSQVPQMLAAGWAGVGSAATHPKFSLAVYEDAPFDLPAPPAVFRKDPEKTSPADRIGAVLRALDRLIVERGIAALPATLDDLERLGLPSAALDELRVLLTRGEDERAIVDAFLAALALRAGRFGAGRHLLRALRRRARSSIASPEVGSTVEAVVASLESKRSAGERLVETLRARSG